MGVSSDEHHGAMFWRGSLNTLHAYNSSCGEEDRCTEERRRAPGHPQEGMEGRLIYSKGKALTGAVERGKRRAVPKREWTQWSRAHTHSPTDPDRDLGAKCKSLVVTQLSHDWVEYDCAAQLALMYPL
jgi:hypothetical protein